jgi:PAS domain S-box-containing protein
MTRPVPDRTSPELLPGVSGEWVRLLELNPDPLLIMDHGGRIVFLNAAAEQLFRVRRSQVIGRALAGSMIRLAPLDGPPFIARSHPFLTFVEEAHDPETLALAYIRRDETRAVLECRLAALSDTGGGKRGLIASIRDVTERHRMAERDRILAEAGRVLVSELDVEAALSGVAATAVPVLGDACGIYLLDADGDGRRVADAGVAGGDPAASIPAEVLGVLASGRARMEGATGAGGALSRFVLPLIARGQTIGALDLCAIRAHDAGDVECAEKLAHIIALGVDNERLRRTAQRALDDAAVQQERAVGILESISDAFWAVDANGCFTYVNHHAENVLGHRRDDLLGRSINSVLTHDFGEQVRHAMASASADQRRRVFEVEAPGLETWLEVHVYPGAGGLSVYLHDIGERRRAADAQRLLIDTGTALAASLDYEETLRRAARVAVPTLADVCTVDLIASGDSIQRVAAAALGGETEERLRRLGRRFPPDPRLPSASLHAVRSGETVIANDLARAVVVPDIPDPELLRLVQELGARAVLLVPLVARGKRLGVVTFAFTNSGRQYTPETRRLAEDVARRAAIAIDNARLYEEAQESSRAKSNFISVMSHEFRTPLTAIVGYTDLLAGEVAGPLTDKQKVQLGRVKQSAWHLTQLIEEVLTFSRVEAGRETVSRELVDLTEIAAKAAALIEPVALEKDLRLHVDIPARPLIGNSDSGKVRQILINLLSNAVKFTSAGEVRLRVWEAENRVLFEVQDTGVGIAPEHLSRIFDSFWQVEQGTTRSFGGTGLGLTISRRLAQLLGGDVDVMSEPGKGSTFTVWLPAPERLPTMHPLPGARITVGRG